MIKHSFIFLILLFLAINVSAVGDPDALCSTISDDLSEAGGCVDEDGFEDSTTSSLSIGMLELGDSSGIVIFMIVLAIINAIFAGLTILKSIKKPKQK